MATSGLEDRRKVGKPGEIGRGSVGEEYKRVISQAEVR